MKKLQVRLAGKDDSRYIALLGRLTFYQTFGHFFRDKQDLLDHYDNTFSVDLIEKNIANPDNIYFIAFADRLPVGYAKLKLNSAYNDGISLERACELEKIYVLDDFLSLKVGFKLQKCLLEKAMEEGFKNVWLVVLHSNERAISFYEKAGFEKVGEKSYSIGKESFDFNIMNLVLSPKSQTYS